jgi:hypothetical protein
MEALYVFLIRNDVWIYILCGLGFVWYFTQLIRSRGILRRSMFGLEIERGQRIMRRSLLLVLLFAIIAAAVTYVNLSIAPTLPPELLKPPTPTPNIFVTPLSSPTPAAGQATPTIALAPTVTLVPAPAGDTPVSETPPATGGVEVTPGTSPSPNEPAAGCTPGSIITSPPNGAIIATTVTFFGSAAAETFSYYTFEVNGPQSGDQWTALPLEAATQQVFDNILASLDVSTWLAGTHAFRLSVYDAADTLLGQCEIQLVVDSASS